MTAGTSLYYRGSHNLARHCTDERTECAHIAIHHLRCRMPFMNGFEFARAVRPMEKT